MYRPLLRRVLKNVWNDVFSYTLDFLSEIRPQTTSSWYVLVPKTCPKFGNPAIWHLDSSWDCYPYFTRLDCYPYFAKLDCCPYFTKSRSKPTHPVRPLRVWWNPYRLFTKQNHSTGHLRLVPHKRYDILRCSTWYCISRLCSTCNWDGTLS